MNRDTRSNNSVRIPAEPAVLNDPLRNRGVAFTLAEREALGLTGRLPSGVLTFEEQARRAWQQAVQDAIWQPAYPDPVS